MPGTQWLLAAPQFEQTIIGQDGWPLRAVVPEPRTFALHKLWVAEQDDRTPLKQPRDRAHARVVADLVRKYMRKPFRVNDMPWLAKELRAQIKKVKA